MLFNWIHHYQLFLFDFDGLLVNTEHLHHQAYREMCAHRGFTLTWDFNRYIQAAHQGAEDLKRQIYSEFPSLQKIEPNWHVLYEEKRQIFIELLQKETVPLMQGVEELLLALQKANITRCVVTHSSKLLTDQIRSHQPLLNTIPHWITREDYQHPKPDPECYQKAISLLRAENQKVIGFEDSPRGLRALLPTEAVAVLVTETKPSSIFNKPFYYYPDLTAIHDKNAPIAH